MKNYVCILLLLTISCTQDSKTIKIKGSDTEVNLAVQLAEAFYAHYPDYVVSVSGGGSGLGIAALINGTTDIANSSRRINDEELRLFKERGVQVDSFVFAQDAIGFVVAADLPLDVVTVKQLAMVLSGKYKNWSELTGKNLRINIYGRQSNSGTYSYVRNKLQIRFSPYAKEMNGNAQILEALKYDHSGIGYVGAGYLIHGGTQGLKVLKVLDKEGVEAISALDSIKIARGQYFFQRPLYQYYMKKSRGKIKAFIDFEKGPEGERIIKQSGYYPVK